MKRLQTQGDLPVDTSRAANILSTRRIFDAWKERPALFQPGEEVIVLTEIKLKKGEPVEKALRRLKKKIDREGTLKIVRAKRTFEKPSAMKRRKMKVARFSAMLSARYADL